MKEEVRGEAPLQPQAKPAAGGGRFRTSAPFFIVMLGTALLMRGPVTSIGPIAEDIRAAFDASYADYGILTAIPIACFGLFSFAAPVLAGRLGLAKAAAAAIFILFIGAFGRLADSWGVLLLATAGVGAGIALLNAFMPVVVKTADPARVGMLMGLYTGIIGLSGAIGGLTSVPLKNAADSIAGTMGFWAAAAAIGLALWLLVVAPAEKPEAAKPVVKPEAGGPGAGLRYMAGRPAAWAVTAVMGLQSLLIYTMSAWMPPYWTSIGMNQAETGVWLFVFLVSGLPASVFTAKFMDWCRSEAKAEIILAALYLVGLAGWLWGGWALLPGSICAGASQGAMLSVACLLMSRKTRSMREMLALSSLAQGVGYLGAGLGPIVFGRLFEGTGGWSASFAFAAAAMIAWGLAGVVASWRDRV